MSLKIIFSSNCVEIDCVTGIGGSEWWLGRNLFIYSCSIDNYFVTKVKYIDSVNTYSCGPSEAWYFILIPAICVIIKLRFSRPFFFVFQRLHMRWEPIHYLPNTCFRLSSYSTRPLIERVCAAIVFFVSETREVQVWIYLLSLFVLVSRTKLRLGAGGPAPKWRHTCPGDPFRRLTQASVQPIPPGSLPNQDQQVMQISLNDSK